jgi:hypothetical protein
MTPLWVSEAAGEFWAAAGGEEGFPRELRGPIARALPLAVVLLPRLRVSAVDDWLRRQGIACAVGARDRWLRACLVARRGQGIAFVDGTDPEDEQRYSLAHELAHFLRDYSRPRAMAAAKLGPGVLAVLDGERPARPEERVDALLARTPIGLHVHLMARDAEGGIADAAIAAAEADADRLAYELLAPGERVLSGGERDVAALAGELVAGYGLPAGAAERYAAELVGPRPAAESFARRLGLVP